MSLSFQQILNLYMEYFTNYVSVNVIPEIFLGNFQKIIYKIPQNFDHLLLFLFIISFLSHIVVSSKYGHHIVKILHLN